VAPVQSALDRRLAATATVGVLLHSNSR